MIKKIFMILIWKKITFIIYSFYCLICSSPFKGDYNAT
jgi:hypothetical protein